MRVTKTSTNKKMTGRERRGGGGVGELRRQLSGPATRFTVLVFRQISIELAGGNCRERDGGGGGSPSPLTQERCCCTDCEHFLNSWKLKCKMIIRNAGWDHVCFIHNSSVGFTQKYLWTNPDLFETINPGHKKAKDKPDPPTLTLTLT